MSDFAPLAVTTKSGMCVTLRGLRRSDAGALARFYRLLDERTDRLYFVLTDFTEDVTEELAELHEEGVELHLVVEAPSGELVGHLSMQPFPARSPRLSVCLLQGWQALGIGRQALSVALDFARREPGVEAVWLSVLEENVVAIRLYESFGFELLGRRKVKRRHSPYRRNVGRFRMLDMVLRFGLPPR